MHFIPNEVYLRAETTFVSEEVAYRKVNEGNEYMKKEACQAGGCVPGAAGGGAVPSPGTIL